MAYPGLVGRGRANKWAAELWDGRLLPHGARSLEWVMPKGTGIQPTAAVLDELYSKTLLAEIPRIIARSLSLEPLEAAAPIPRQVNVYLEQATKCFVAGLYDGCVALSRACLEETLTDRVGMRIGHQDRELKAWIDEARRLRLLTPAQCTAADSVRVAGNAVLHDASTTEALALQALQTLRALLAELYR